MPPQDDSVTLWNKKGDKSVQVTPDAADQWVAGGWSKNKPAPAAPTGTKGQQYQAARAGLPKVVVPLDKRGMGARFGYSMLEGANPFHAPSHPESLPTAGKAMDITSDAMNLREITRKAKTGDIAGAAGMQIGTVLGGEGLSHAMGWGAGKLAKTPVGEMVLKNLGSASARAKVTAAALGSGVTSQMAYVGEKLIQPIFEALGKKSAPLDQALAKKIITLSPRAEQLIRGLNELEPEMREHIGGLIRETGEKTTKTSTKVAEKGAKEAASVTRDVGTLSKEVNAARDTNIFQKLQKEHPDWNLSKIAQEAAKESSKIRASKAASSSAFEAEKTATTSTKKGMNVRSALTYDEAKNLLEHLKNVADGRGMGEQSRLGQLIKEIDSSIETEAKNAGMAGQRADLQNFRDQMNQLKNIAIREMRERGSVKKIVGTVSKRAAKMFDEESQKQIPEEFVMGARDLYKRLTGAEMPKGEESVIRSSTRQTLKAGAWGARYIPPISRAIISMFSGDQGGGV